MSNLQTHIASLEALITKANALPTEKKIQDGKTITPTKNTQTAQPDSGYDGLAQVTVNPIPDEYQDVSNVTATAARTAAGDVFVDADGVEQTGKLNMSTIDIFSNEFGSQRIGATLLDAGSQNFLRIDASDLGNAEECYVLSGYTFASNHAADVVNAAGTMPNNGTLSSTIDGLETKSVSIPMGYTDGGTVALDSTIDDTADSQAAQIAEIKAMLEGKSASGGGSGGAVETCTVNVTRQDSSIGVCALAFTCYENGEIYSQCYGSDKYDIDTVSDLSFTIANVVCGSGFDIGYECPNQSLTYSSSGIDVYGVSGSSGGYHCVGKITAEAGSTATFNIEILNI